MIGDDQAILLGVQAGGGFANERVGPIAQRLHHGVGFDDKVRAFHRHGLAAAFCIRLAKLHLDAFNLGKVPLLVGDKAHRLGQKLVMSALFQGQLAILHAARHFLDRAAVQAGDFLCAHAQRGAQAV